MTHKQFINKPKSKTRKDYDYTKYIQTAKVYRDMPRHICECGVRTISMRRHLQSIRHVNAMMKLNPPEINL
jgi:Mg2+ and Co2+ transporter CorA